MQPAGHDPRRLAGSKAVFRSGERPGHGDRGQFFAAFRWRIGYTVDVPGTRGSAGYSYKLIYRGFQVAGCEPDEMGIGPVFAVPKLLKRSGLTVNDIDLWELNEAFAVQVIYCRDRLGIDPEKFNVNGGSISIGHPSA